MVQKSGISYQASVKQDNFFGYWCGSKPWWNQKMIMAQALILVIQSLILLRSGVSLGGNVFFENYDNSKSETSSTYKRTTYGETLL